MDKIIGVNFPVREYKYSTFVILSSLLFLIPTVVFALNKEYLIAIAIALSCFFSVLGDSIFPNTKIYNIYDRFVATLLTFILIVRHFSLHKNPEVIFLVKLIFPLCMYKYSSLATTQEEWEIRHSLWHISAVCVFLSEV